MVCHSFGTEIRSSSLTVIKKILINSNFMSIIGGVHAQSPEPEARDKVLDNNPDRIGI